MNNQDITRDWEKRLETVEFGFDVDSKKLKAFIKDLLETVSTQVEERVRKEERDTYIKLVNELQEIHRKSSKTMCEWFESQLPPLTNSKELNVDLLKQDSKERKLPYLEKAGTRTYKQTVETIKKIEKKLEGNGKKEIHTVCFPCGNKYDRKKKGTMGAWIDTCDICGEKNVPCADAQHDFGIYNNPKEVAEDTIQDLI